MFAEFLEPAEANIVLLAGVLPALAAVFMLHHRVLVRTDASTVDATAAGELPERPVVFTVQTYFFHCLLTSNHFLLVPAGPIRQRLRLAGGVGHGGRPVKA